MVTTAPSETPILYCHRLAGLFGLGHWRIEHDPTDPGEETLAAMRVVNGQQRALLQIGRLYRGLSPDDQRSTILHELIHIYLWPATEALEGITPLLGTHAAQVAVHHHDLAIERATDAISVAIGSHFPLPGGR